MPIIARDSGGADREPIPADVHHAVCVGVVDIGTQPQGNSKYTPKPKVMIQWELPECRRQYEKDGKEYDVPDMISKPYTNSLNEKANLRKDLDAWRGRPFTEDELDGFDLVNIIGVNCLLQIVHRKVGDKTYANIASIMKLPKRDTPVKPERSTLYFTLEDVPEGSTSVPWPEEMPDWLRDKIMASEEYQERFGEYDPGNGEPPPHGDSDFPEDEDDIPF